MSNFNIDYLRRLTKEQLIEDIKRYEEEKEKLEDEIYTLRNEMVKSRFNEYMYDDFLRMKEELENEFQKNRLNYEKIMQLEELLERYKNIVDRLGGNKYEL